MRLEFSFQSLGIVLYSSSYCMYTKPLVNNHSFIDFTLEKRVMYFQIIKNALMIVKIVLVLNKVTKQPHSGALVD